MPCESHGCYSRLFGCPNNGHHVQSDRVNVDFPCMGVQNKLDPTLNQVFQRIFRQVSLVWRMWLLTAQRRQQDCASVRVTIRCGQGMHKASLRWDEMRWGKELVPSNFVWWPHLVVKVGMNRGQWRFCSLRVFWCNPRPVLPSSTRHFREPRGGRVTPWSSLEEMGPVWFVQGKTPIRISCNNM